MTKSANPKSRKSEKQENSDMVEAAGAVIGPPELALLNLEQFPVVVGPKSSRKNRVHVSAQSNEIEGDQWGIAARFILDQLIDEDEKAKISADYVFTIAHDSSREGAGTVEEFAEFIIWMGVWPQFASIVGMIGSQLDPPIGAPPKHLWAGQIEWSNEDNRSE